MTESLQITLHPVVAGDRTGLIKRDTAGHGQEVAHRQIFLPDKAKKAHIFPENVHNLRIQRKLSFGYQKTDSHGSHTFTHGIGCMPELLPVRIKSRLSDDFSSLQYHHIMHMKLFGGFKFPEKLLDLPGVDPLRLR